MLQLLPFKNPWLLFTLPIFSNMTIRSHTVASKRLHWKYRNQNFKRILVPFVIKFSEALAIHTGHQWRQQVVGTPSAIQQYIDLGAFGDKTRCVSVWTGHYRSHLLTEKVNPLNLTGHIYLDSRMLLFLHCFGSVTFFKKLILLFSKDAVNLSKVTLKAFIMLQKIFILAKFLSFYSCNFLFIKESWRKKRPFSQKYMNLARTKLDKYTY